MSNIKAFNFNALNDILIDESIEVEENTKDGDVENEYLDDEFETNIESPRESYDNNNNNNNNNNNKWSDEELDKLDETNQDNNNKGNDSEYVDNLSDWDDNTVQDDNSSIKSKKTNNNNNINNKDNNNKDNNHDRYDIDDDSYNEYTLNVNYEDLVNSPIKSDENNKINDINTDIVIETYNPDDDINTDIVIETYNPDDDIDYPRSSPPLSSLKSSPLPSSSSNNNNSNNNFNKNSNNNSEVKWEIDEFNNNIKSPKVQTNLSNNISLHSQQSISSHNNNNNNNNNNNKIDNKIPKIRSRIKSSSSYLSNVTRVVNLEEMPGFKQKLIKEEKYKESTIKNNELNESISYEITNAIDKVGISDKYARGDLIKVITQLLKDENDKKLIKAKNVKFGSSTGSITKPPRISMSATGGISKNELEKMEYGEEILGTHYSDPDYDIARQINNQLLKMNTISKEEVLHSAMHSPIVTTKVMNDNEKSYSYNKTTNKVNESLNSNLSNLSIDVNIRNGGYKGPVSPSRIPIRVNKANSVSNNRTNNSRINNNFSKNVVNSLLNTQTYSREDEEKLKLLGIDRDKLNNDSESLYATFLSDIIDLCRKRAMESTTVEEMAMHRSLSEYVSECFAADSIVTRVRGEMIDAAVTVACKKL